MSDEDDFEPRLGRIGSRAGKAPRRLGFRASVLASAMLASGGRFGRAAPSRRFTGARIGKGAGVAAMLGSRDRLAAFRARRVIVKISAPRLAGKGLGAAKAHMRYLQRDGVTLEGAPGQLYGADTDRADGKAFLERAEAGADRRQFRLIVSAEDGAEYDDLKGLTRRLMRQVEADLGTGLDWVAVDHHNTGHPHTHILVRGRDDRGRDLVIAKDYLTQGLRERAVALVSLDLGPRSDLEIRGRLQREIVQERLTSLDRGLLRDVGDDGLVSPRHGEPLQHAARVGRLRTLERLGLAREAGPPYWRLADDLEATLRQMGERGDIQKTLRRAVVDADLARADADLVIHDPGAAARPLVGRLLRRGLADEARDRHYLVIDGVDGRAHYVDIGRGEATEAVGEGAIVRISARPVQARAVDQTVARIAADHDGRYSAALHRLVDPSASPAFVEAHVRRLEALRRARCGVEREADGAWRIGVDHLDRALAFEAERARATPVLVTPLSRAPLERLATTMGPTWLDRELLEASPEPLRDAGFGRQARQALAARRQWLIDQGLAQQDGDQVLYRRGLLAELGRRERELMGAALAQEIGRPYAETRSGQRVEGIYRRGVDLAGERMAVIERSRDFTLVPWRPVLDGREGQPVSGVLRGDAISWTIGRGRSGPTIS